MQQQAALEFGLLFSPVCCLLWQVGVRYFEVHTSAGVRVVKYLL